MALFAVETSIYLTSKKSNNGLLLYQIVNSLIEHISTESLRALGFFGTISVGRTAGSKEDARGHGPNISSQPLTPPSDGPLWVLFIVDFIFKRHILPF